VAGPPARIRSNPRAAAWVLVAMLMVCLVVLLPFAVSSAFTDVREQTSQVHRFVAPEFDVTNVISSVNLEVTGINEFDGTAAVRVSIDRSCLLQCEWADRYVIVMLGLREGEEIQSRPASATITLPKESLGISQSVIMPVLGDPVRYPFDRYRLDLGLVVQRSEGSGAFRPLNPDEARRYLVITLSSRAPRITMGHPDHIDFVEMIGAENVERLPIVFAQELTFRRPLYLQILTILLILLVTAAAAYAVFLRPLDQLIINSGALVLGVWGIRSILLGVTLPGITLVDLSLSMVILFLLAAITVRTLWLLEEESGLQLFRRFHRSTPPKPPPPPTPEYVPESEVRAPQMTGD
jgi:hypothetical protein